MLAVQPSVRDRCQQRGVIPLVGLRVRSRKRRDRPIERVRRPDVGGDLHCVTRARVRPGEGPRVLTERESAACSSYRLALGGRTVRIRFQRAADATDRAAALASMVAKYTRELFMEGLNGFFASRVAGLRPTAGYYEDGRRFLGEVRGVLRDLGCPEGAFVRAR